MKRLHGVFSFPFPLVNPNNTLHILLECGLLHTPRDGLRARFTEGMSAYGKEENFSFAELNQNSHVDFYYGTSCLYNSHPLAYLLYPHQIR